MRSKRSELDSRIRPILEDVAFTKRGVLESEASLQKQIAEIDLALGKITGHEGRELSGQNLRKLEDLETQKPEREKDRRSAEEFLEALPVLNGEVKNLHLAKSRDRLKALPSDHPYRRAAQDIAGKLLTLEKEIGRFRDGLLPRSFYLVFVLLAWIAATGIVLPLAALPGYTQIWILSKPILLAAFILGLVVLGGYFAGVLKEVHDLGKVTWI